jgi:decaprenyl-phosphate phosphoribosyltransferase
MARATLVLEKKPTRRSRIHAHLSMMRLDHSVKQLFVLPGVMLAWTLSGTRGSAPLFLHILVGMVAVTFVASSNYVLNEILDAPFDRLHPTKHIRPAASGVVHIPLGYLQWLLLGVAGLLLARFGGHGVLWSCLALWFMGCVYNIPPVRTKDTPYLDVLSESINNPLRFCVGWCLVAPLVIPPASMLISYWMLGAYFMSLKRFSEYRQIGPAIARLYRRSFEYYTEKSLLNSVVFYAAAGMLFFGAFIMRYRLELVFAFPLIALLMSVYFDLAFEADSAVQNPEKLLGEPKLVILITACIVLLFVLLHMRMPWLNAAFPKSFSR